MIIILLVAIAVVVIGIPMLGAVIGAATLDLRTPEQRHREDSARGLDLGRRIR